MGNAILGRISVRVVEEESTGYMTKISSTYLIQQECLLSEVFMSFDSESFMKMLAFAREKRQLTGAPFIC